MAVLLLIRWCRYLVVIWAFRRADLMARRTAHAAGYGGNVR